MLNFEVLQPNNTSPQVQTGETTKRQTLIKTASGLLPALAVVAALAYFVLQSVFDYPRIWNEGGAIALPLFNQNSLLISLTFGLLALTGLLLMVFSLLYYKAFASPKRHRVLIGLTGLGLLAGLTRLVSLGAWSLVGPSIAETFSRGGNAAAGANQNYDVLNTFTLITGELVGTLLLAAWTVGMALQNSGKPGFPKWLSWFGFLAAFGLEISTLKPLAKVLGLNLAPLEATDFNWEALLGSFYGISDALWLIWLVWVGLKLARSVTPPSTKASAK